MTITRRGLADEIDRLDDEIAELQKDKAGIFQAYRAQLDRDGMGKPGIAAEVTAIKAAIRRRQAMADDPLAVEAKDALVDEIYVEISGSGKAGTVRATRARAPRASDGDTKVTISSGGQSIETTSGALSKLAQTMKTPAGRAAMRRAAETTRDMERLAAEVERDPEGGEGGTPPSASNPPPQAAPAPAAAQSSVTGAEPASGAGRAEVGPTGSPPDRQTSALPPWHTPHLVELDPATELPIFLLRDHPDCAVRATGPPQARPP